MSADSDRVLAALQTAAADLLAQRQTAGFWEGELSSSALSTATAVTALSISLAHGALSRNEAEAAHSQIEAGLQWLAQQVNADGGWGDTIRSLSNISTTTLCWAAFGAARADERFLPVVARAAQWLNRAIDSAVPSSDGLASAGHPAVDPDRLARAIIARYGKDRTFSVPILTMCALSGRLGTGRQAWRHVIPLPFELAACPHQLFAALRLPVVSYALPALIAIGQAHHVHAPSANPFARLIRNATRRKTLRVLSEIQPKNGGFLEATPLTSFVTMSLAASGQAQNVVTQRGLEFLRQSQRPDGSWPIDTNLATWCTTLSIEALPEASLSPHAAAITEWLLRQQYTSEHPYTHAPPGGWAWTDLPGGVPDADDTSGALLALAKLRTDCSEEQRARIRRAAEQGMVWLLNLQNRDGGVPTFCRGWGALPFDRSSADITAHAVRAWILWHDEFPAWQPRLRRAVAGAIEFLARIQEPDGALAPLWFGNQFARDESNRTYGTARVLSGLNAVLALQTFRSSVAEGIAARCASWLIEAQNADGGWGGEGGVISSTEETALAVEALFRANTGDSSRRAESVRRGLNWLVHRVESGEWRESSPIGFYFAKLWYFERLYPMIFTVGALRAAMESHSQIHEASAWP